MRGFALSREAIMTLVRDDAQRFWEEDLSVIEKRFLGARAVIDLPAMKEEPRVPNQGSVLAFSTINIDTLIGRPGLRVWAEAFKQFLFRKS